MTYRIFPLWRDEGDGGGAGADDANPGGTQGNQGPANAGGGQTDPGKANTGAGNQDNNSADGKDKAADAETKYNQLLEKYNTLTKNVGKQSKTVGDLRAQLRKIEDDPEGFIETLAKKRGIKVRVNQDDPDADLEKVLESGDEDKIAEFRRKNREQRTEKSIIDRVLDKVSPALKTIRESQLAQRFNDWDDLTDDRRDLSTALVTGTITMDEGLHYMVRGMRLPEILNEAKAKAVEEYKESLGKKSAGQLDGAGGEGGGGEKSKSMPAEQAAAILNALPPG